MFLPVQQCCSALAWPIPPPVPPVVDSANRHVRSACQIMTPKALSSSGGYMDGRISIPGDAAAPRGGSRFIAGLAIPPGIGSPVRGCRYAAAPWWRIGCGATNVNTRTISAHLAVKGHNHEEATPPPGSMCPGGSHRLRRRRESCRPGGTTIRWRRLHRRFRGTRGRCDPHRHDDGRFLLDGDDDRGSARTPRDLHSRVGRLKIGSRRTLGVRRRVRPKPARVGSLPFPEPG